jgi:hypothetical protein
MATRTLHRPHVDRRHAPPSPSLPPPLAPTTPPTPRGRRFEGVLPTLLVIALGVTALVGLFLTIQGSGATEYTRGQLADMARLEAQAETYLEAAQQAALQRSYEADAARWIARAEYFQQQHEAGVNAAATARLEGLARDYRLSQLSRGDRAYAERLHAQAQAELQP